MADLTIEQVEKEMGFLTKMVQEAEKNEANLSGQLQASMKRLKEENGLSSVEAAEKELKKTEDEKASLASQIFEKFNTLKTTYDFEGVL